MKLVHVSRSILNTMTHHSNKCSMKEYTDSLSVRDALFSRRRSSTSCVNALFLRWSTLSSSLPSVNAFFTSPAMKGFIISAMVLVTVSCRNSAGYSSSRSSASCQTVANRVKVGKGKSMFHLIW